MAEHTECIQEILKSFKLNKTNPDAEKVIDTIEYGALFNLIVEHIFNGRPQDMDVINLDLNGSLTFQIEPKMIVEIACYDKQMIKLRATLDDDSLSAEQLNMTHHYKFLRCGKYTLIELSIELSGGRRAEEVGHRIKDFLHESVTIQKMTRVYNSHNTIH